MKFGVNTFIWADHFDAALYSLLPRLKAAAFDGVEIPLIEPGGMDAGEIRRALADAGLECTFCSVLPAGLNLISEDSGVRRRTIEHLERCIETAKEIGGAVIAGPLYAPVGYLPGRRRTAEEWRFAVDGFQWLGPVAESHGVTLAIEPLNRFETYFLNTTADGAALCAEIGNSAIGLLFDTFHANIEEKDVAGALRAAMPAVRHVHTSENDRGTPGTGHTDWRGVLSCLKEAGYDGWLTIESFGFSLGALSAAASIWRDLAPSPEHIAFEGVRFLRENAEGHAA